MENTRLIAAVEAQSKEHNGQFTRLLEMIKNIKEEVDVDRVVTATTVWRRSTAPGPVTSSPARTSPAWSTTQRRVTAGFMMHRQPGTGTGLVGKSMGDRTGNKSKKGKPAAPRMSSSLSTSGCQVSTSAMG